MKFNDVTFTLGKGVTNYESVYNPNLLARHPRSINRDKYAIDTNRLPFVGYDVWHAYEETFLLQNGQPLNFILKLKVPADSNYLVESKSLKLYLFSFAMQKIPGSEQEAISTFCSTVEHDLSDLLECKIQVTLFQEKNYAVQKDNFLSTAQPLDTLVDFSTITFDAVGEDPTLLKTSSKSELYIKSDMLRSKCLITGQPDTGTIFIYMKGTSTPTYESLAKYIFALREEHHFHEEIVECFYKRLYDLYKPEDLMVTALYNRRGGIDICPSRANKAILLPLILGNVKQMTTKEYRQ